MYQSAKAFVISSFACLCACSDESQGNPAVSPTEQTFESATPAAGDAPSMGQIGQVRFGYDPNRLIRAEVQVKLPPDFREKVWATKLIPVDRAMRLGEETCRYGRSGSDEVCTAEAEDGLAMALLERQIGDYRRALLDSGVPEDELGADMIAAVEGFSFTAQADGSRMQYRFFPVEERTLLLALTYSGGQMSADPAIADVLETISFSS